MWIVTVVSLCSPTTSRKVHRCYLARKLNEVGWNRWNVNNCEYEERPDSVTRDSPPTAHVLLIPISIRSLMRG